MFPLTSWGALIYHSLCKWWWWAGPEAYCSQIPNFLMMDKELCFQPLFRPPKLFTVAKMVINKILAIAEYFLCTLELVWRGPLKIYIFSSNNEPGAESLKQALEVRK